MDKKKIINKVVITTDAEFDYESEFKCRLQKLQLKQEIEDYIRIRLKNFNGYYCRVKFYDEFTNEMLILFVYKGDTFGCMQMWEVRGICKEEDWTNELEDDGNIRCWLKSKIEPNESTDWVWDLRIAKVIQRKELSEQFGEDVESYMQEILNILKNYKINKSKIAVGNGKEIIALKEEMDFIDKCIEQLDEESKAIIIFVYVQGLSLSKVGRVFGYCKSAIHKKRNRALQILEILYESRE